ncbi:GNAT family N-acetyltransferase [Sphingomonas astaxanthinifaciens]|uniref:N-acetyltransferase n=1 Tax=Sphingomonas astaxanthinifaciens DSM 22298 TaxID=1123267 RepID=A0ABQ5ZAE5_9SPHN|nr:GNAT family N-acetyltransferase [Sphingomonas astaxanthinifaciens]GLR47587.1 N-acetyltransferase [Sphingomonas astaxanthinifaciens DSM 22298]
MTLEEARTEDLPTLHALVERAYRGDTARQGWSHEADLLSGPRTSVAELQAILDDPARHLLVCRDEDGAVRCCVLLWEKDDGLVYLGMLTIDPALQGTGRGKRLLAAAEQWAREHLGANRMEMQVFDRRRELLAFYDRRGYRPTGERRPFPYAEAPDAGALYDDLEFVVLEKPL